MCMFRAIQQSNKVLIFFKDKNGTPGIFKGIKDGTEFTDVGGKGLTAAVTAPMKRDVRRAGSSLDSFSDEEYCKKISSHHRVLEPLWLTKRLAGDLI